MMSAILCRSGLLPRRLQPQRSLLARQKSLRSQPKREGEWVLLERLVWLLEFRFLHRLNIQRRTAPASKLINSHLPLGIFLEPSFVDPLFQCLKSNAFFHFQSNKWFTNYEKPFVCRGYTLDSNCHIRGFECHKITVFPHWFPGLALYEGWLSMST